MPTNNIEPWGLIVPGRAPTPSEGAAQTYQRVGPPGTQRTRTFDNGTSLTFGPLDPVDEFDPSCHPFREQIAEIDTVIWDCWETRLRYGGRLMAGAEDSEGVPITIKDPFNGFRQYPERDVQKLSFIRLPSGTYIQVASKHATCQRNISYYSMGNARIQHDNTTDSRFGVTTKPEGAQPRRFSGQRRGGRGRTHVSNGRRALRRQQNITDSEDDPTEQGNTTQGRLAPTGPRHITDRRDLIRGMPRSNENRGVYDKDSCEHARTGRGRAESYRGRGGHMVNARPHARGSDGPPNVGAEIREKYINAANTFNRAYRGFQMGRATQAPAANRITSRETFNAMQQSQVLLRANREPFSVARQSYGKSYRDKVRARQEEVRNNLVDIVSPRSQKTPMAPALQTAPAPGGQYTASLVHIPQPSRQHRRRGNNPNRRAEAGQAAREADHFSAQVLNQGHNAHLRQGGQQPHGPFNHGDRTQREDAMSGGVVAPAPPPDGRVSRFAKFW